jgi:hypothetical protein
MNKFIAGIINFIEDDRGAKSSKRISGLFLVFSGGCAKLALIAYGAKIKLLTKFTLYDKIDATADGLLIAGVALLTGAMIEKFRKKDDK